MQSTQDVCLPPGADSRHATPLGTKLANRGSGKMTDLSYHSTGCMLH